MTGGPARFTRNSTSPALLGVSSTSGASTSTGLSPTPVRLPRRFDFNTPFITGRTDGSRSQKTPQPRTCNTCRFEHTHGLASSAFARHYSRNHILFSLPAGTEMFHFPTFPPTPLYIQGRVTGHDSGNSRFPHSDTPGSQLVNQLPGAYRRLQRPSSALGAKASTDRT